MVGLLIFDLLMTITTAIVSFISFIEVERITNSKFFTFKNFVQAVLASVLPIINIITFIGLGYFLATSEEIKQEILGINPCCSFLSDPPVPQPHV